MDTVIFVPDLIEYAFFCSLICSFPFRCKSYGRRVFKWITQHVLLTFALVKLLAFAPLFNAQKKHVLNYFALEMAAIFVARRRHRREQRVCGRRERIFSTRINLLWMQEWKYCLPSHVIFNLLQEIRQHGTPIYRRYINELWLLYFFILCLQLC